VTGGTTIFLYRPAGLGWQHHLNSNKRSPAYHVKPDFNISLQNIPSSIIFNYPKPYHRIYKIIIQSTSTPYERMTKPDYRIDTSTIHCIPIEDYYHCFYTSGQYSYSSYILHNEHTGHSWEYNIRMMCISHIR
jgi:hypothetical protein